MTLLVIHFQRNTVVEAEIIFSRVAVQMLLSAVPINALCFAPRGGYSACGLRPAA